MTNTALAVQTGRKLTLIEFLEKRRLNPEPPPELDSAAAAFAKLLHSKSSGYRLLTSQQPRLDGSIGKPFHQFIRGRDYPNEVRKIEGKTGYFYSFSTFLYDGRADTQSLESLTALYQDLDWHSHPEASRRYHNVDEIIDAVDARCDRMNFPRPNLVIHSGRGCQAAWLHDPILAMENKHHDTWYAVQRYLCREFSDLGADPKAAPAPHFFKLPGQVNPKSGRTVAAVRRPEDDRRFRFENLLHSLFPGGVISVNAEKKKTKKNKTTSADQVSPQKSDTLQTQVISLAARRAIAIGRLAVAERRLDGLGATAGDVSRIDLVSPPTGVADDFRAPRNAAWRSTRGTERRYPFRHRRGA